MDWRFKLGSVPFRGKFYSANKQFLSPLPVRSIEFSSSKSSRDTFKGKIREELESFLRNNSNETIKSLKNKINKEKLDLVHDGVSILAKKITELTTTKEKLGTAIEPFKYFSRGTGLSEFQEVFSEEIKYGKLIKDQFDPTTSRHDLDGLKLVEKGNTFELQIQLKKRDPEDWKEHLKEGHNIIREWVPIYQFDSRDLNAKKKVFYEEAFLVLEKFEEFTSYPGGYTRTTLEKLKKTSVPVFNPKTNLQDLVDLKREMTETQEKISSLDKLIDEVVFDLYELNNEEIQIVENN